MDKLQDARAKINAIDKQMAELFESRMQAAKTIAEYKKELWCLYVPLHRSFGCGAFL